MSEITREEFETVREMLHETAKTVEALVPLQQQTTQDIRQTTQDIRELNKSISTIAAGQAALAERKDTKGIGVIVAFAAPVLSLVFILIWVVWSEITTHAADKHPTRVEARVGELKEKLNALKETTAREYLQRDEYERQQGVDKLQLATKLADTRVEVVKDISRLVARQELLLQGMVESMKLGGGAGRHAAENQGRVDAEIRSLQQQMERE